MNDLLILINLILKNKGKDEIASINGSTSLRNDIGFDSLDLAEFTVRVEEKYGMDVFEDGLVDTIDAVVKKIGL